MLPLFANQNITRKTKKPTESTYKSNYLFSVNNTCFPIRKKSLTGMRLLVLQIYV